MPFHDITLPERAGPTGPSPAQVSGQQLAFAKPEDQAAQQQQAEPASNGSGSRAAASHAAPAGAGQHPCRTERLAPYWSAGARRTPGQNGGEELDPYRHANHGVAKPQLLMDKERDHRQRQTNGHIGQKTANVIRKSEKFAEELDVVSVTADMHYSRFAE